MVSARPVQAFIPPRYYAILLDVLSERGHDPAALALLSGIPADAFVGDESYLTLAQVEGVASFYRFFHLQPGHTVLLCSDFSDARLRGRLPRYVRGHVGTVSLVHGAHVFADRHAATPPGAPFDQRPEWLYTVVFDGAELWGPSAEAGTQVSVDAWEPYLEHVDRDTP